MPQRGFFFDSIANDRVYSSLDWSRMSRRFATDGVVMQDELQLRVDPQAPVAMQVRVRTGSGFVQGRMVEVFDTPVSLAINTVAGNNRIDRIVVRRDLSSGVRNIFLAVKEGTPATSPVPPTLQRDAVIWEISLAQVFVADGVTTITAPDITDERFNSLVCGISLPQSQSGLGEWVTIGRINDGAFGTPFVYATDIPENIWDELRVSGIVWNSGGNNSLLCRINNLATGYTYRSSINDAVVTETARSAWEITRITGSGPMAFEFIISGRPFAGTSTQIPRLSVSYAANGRETLPIAIAGFRSPSIAFINHLRVFLEDDNNGAGRIVLSGRRLV